MKQNQASPGEYPFSYLWIANCVLYSVVVAFLLNKGCKKQRSGTPAGSASKQQKWKRVYEERVVEVRKKISIAQAELERIKENRKITKTGKRNCAVLEKECKGLSAAKLVSFMEKQKAIERFHMTSRRPCWCSKTKEWWPCWCTKLILWELNSIFMQILSFVSVIQFGYWSRE